MAQRRKRTLSLRRSILLIFVFSLIVSVCCSGILVFRNWISSAKKTTEQIASDINANIYSQVRSYIQTPHHINEINHKVIKNGMLDLSDDKQRDRFFVEILRAYSDEIYSFSYGTVNGEYYGARRNEKGIIEIMRNNASTNGNSWYYTVNEDLTAGELALQAGKFDPRTRAWYKIAVETGGPAFSPLYKHFVIDGLAMSAAWPIYNDSGELEGVLGSHMLLFDIGNYLNSAVDRYNGIAFIIEKETGHLVANSMGFANFTVLEDGTLEANVIENIENPDFRAAYELYKSDPNHQQFFRGSNDNYFINSREINLNGIDWIVVSAVPESLLMSDIYTSMRWATFIAALSILLSILICNLFIEKFLRPMVNLLQVSDELASGNLSKRVDVVRNDEIGIISQRFNSVADRMQAHIENLESIVQERTKELQKANLSLEESREDLRLILDSAAEGIYGTDLEGNCTFCNRSCVRLLGYNDQNELLGKNMHELIHHTTIDGEHLPISDCLVHHTYKEGHGSHSDDEVFWRADGTPFDVEYYSFPQIKYGEIIGSVVTFLDITERKQKEAEIHYLNCYDPLTGLQNRRCFDENHEKIDIPDNLPLSVIFADLNGLKLTNDIFGHPTGDELLKKSAEILNQNCRNGDMVARIGGDEFIMLLPNTDAETANTIMTKIRSLFANVQISGIQLSISLGLDTKYSVDQSLDSVLANAENAMYKDKSINRQSVNRDIIDSLIDALHTKSPREKQHSILVRDMCADIGVALQLPETEISKLSRAGYLHDIGKIVLDKSILSSEVLSDDQFEEMRQHSAVGYRILNLFDDTLDLAEYIYGHHERWDGTGYPRGLEGEQIPQISRIIAVAETYERVLNRGNLPLEERKQIALNEIIGGAGTQFDPHIVKVFEQIMK